jgi:hypothetical protein
MLVSGVECYNEAVEPSLEITASYCRINICGGANLSIGRHGSFTTFAGAGVDGGATLAIGIAGNKSYGVGAGVSCGFVDGVGGYGAMGVTTGDPNSAYMEGGIAFGEGAGCSTTASGTVQLW